MAPAAPAHFDSLWLNLDAATMTEDGGYGIIEDAAIGIKDGKIAFIGPADELPGDTDALTDYAYDADGRVATPGLIDCHTHLAYAGNRAAEFEQRLQGVSYEEIAKKGGGILSTVAATREADEEEIGEKTLARLTALFQQGVTTLEIKSGYGLDLETERKLLTVATILRDETGLRIQRTFLGAHALPPEYKGKADDYITLVCDEMLPALAEEGLIDAVDAFCEHIGFSTGQTARVFDAAQKLGLPVKLHAEQLSNQHGAALAAKYKALSADHLEYLDEDGVKAMAQAGMTAVLLPGAYYYLRETQLPPVDLLRKHKVPMAIATDHNPGTSPVLAPILMLNMACTLFRMTPAEALAGMTRNAARALGWQADCGTLELGKSADVALWDIDHPRDLAYRFGHNPCRGVLLAGEWHAFEEGH
ncbi:MAG: imidazolonepropionase [Alphaproteobacteria bacterium]|nr:imidazolonepropionase [Alphaproteobacteria bacterium]